MAVKALAAITLMHTTDGQSVASIGAQYYVSTSKTTQAGGSWSDSFPAWQANHYLWIRQKIIYKTPAKTEYTTPFVDTSWEKVNEVSSQLVEVSTRLTGAETSIQKNKQAIDLKASTTYVTESTNKAVTAAKSYTDAQLKITAGNMTSEITQKIGALQIGGRNLLKQSGITVSNTAYGIHDYYLTETPVEGQEYTLTLWGELGSDREAFRPFNSGDNCPLILDSDMPGMKEIRKNVYQATFKWNNGVDPNAVKNPTFLRIYQFTMDDKSASTINRIKLEAGNTGTDWNPAPEDLESYADSKVEQSATNLTLSFSQNYETKDDAATSSTNLSDAFQTALDTTQKDLAESAATQYSSLKGQIDQYNEYFDFSKDGLVIGKTGSPVKLREENDKIAFTANGQDLMYLKSGVLNISEVDIKSVLKLGPLAFRDLGNGRWEIS